MVLNLERVLVIEDDTALRTAVVRIIGGWGDAELIEAGTAAEARELLAGSAPPDLMIMDVRLPDHSAFNVLEAAAELSPAPVIVAMSGKASPHEAFRLREHGVRAYLSKPFSAQELADTIETARNATPNLEPLITASVGRVPMRELQKEVRRVMLKEALAQTEGSRSGTARLLHVTRQAVQQMLRSEEEPPSDAPPPPHPKPRSPTAPPALAVS